MEQGSMTMEGTLEAKLIRGSTYKAPLSWKIRNTLRWSFLWGTLAVWVAKAFSKITQIPTLTSELQAVKIHGDTGLKEDFGVLGRRVVTDAFVQFMVDQLQADTTQWGDFKYHDSGVGSTAENAADTDIETTDGESRATGSQEEGASANIYKSIGTIAYTTSKSIVEHGLFSQATGTTLMDRTVFSVISVVNGDLIQFTYQLTCNSGS